MCNEADRAPLINTILDNSLEPENIRNLVMTARPLIKEIPEGKELEIIGGKGY